MGLLEPHGGYRCRDGQAELGRPSPSRRCAPGSSHSRLREREPSVARRVREGRGRRSTVTKAKARSAPIVVVHDRAQAEAALQAAAELARPVVLMSPPGFALYTGAA